MCCYKNQKAFWLVLISVAISVTVATIVAIAVKHRKYLLESEKDADIKECGC